LLLAGGLVYKKEKEIALFLNGLINILRFLR